MAFWMELRSLKELDILLNKLGFDVINGAGNTLNIEDTQNSSNSLC